jgi:probable HAF family extracellular repeat protein
MTLHAFHARRDALATPVRPGLRALATVLALIAGGPALAGTTYTATKLLAPDGSTLWASAINDSGEFVGSVTEVGSVVPVAFAARLDGFFHTYTDPKQHIAGANAIDNNGDIAGNLLGSNARGMQADRSVFRASSGQVVDMFQGHWKDSSAPTGINSSAVVVGSYVRYPRVGQLPTSYGYMWKDGQVTFLGSLGGVQTTAYAINDANVIVGRSTLTTDSRPVHHAFAWSDGVMSDLGGLNSAHDSDAWRINGGGWVVGSSEIDAHRHKHATLWRDGEIIDLGTLDTGGISEAFGVNDAGVIVGYSQNANGTLIRAFLWQDGVLQDLNTLVTNLPPGTALGNATFVNNAGQILAGGSDASGRSFTYLLQSHAAP